MEQEGSMSQSWIARLLQEQAEAIARHLRYVAAHEAIMRVLQDVSRQAITEAQAMAQLEEAAASLDEPGLVALYRQIIERLRQRQEERA
jgi:hypothetical protein